MVMSFRVSELQVLLGYAGRNKGGRKQELLQRALVLVQKGCSTPVQIKIRELYRQIYASNQRRRLETPGGIAGGEPTQQMVNPGMAPIGALDFSTKNLAAVGPMTSAIPVHPDVRFKRLPFYDILGELLKPTSLMPKNNSRFQESYFVFHLTPQQAQDIAMSRDFRPGTKCEYTVQVQLRFCLLETSCEQDDNFPPSICVRVNSKMAQLPNPIPTSKPGVEPKRPGRPVDITSLCRISPTVSNHLDVSWASEFGRGYCLAVYLVRRLSSDILLQRLKQFGNRHPDHTRALIKEKLAHDPDSEVATTSLRVSLMCPLGKMRMTLPCRSSTCTHLQCFDASTFLLMNEKKPTWICPVCDKPAPFDKLIIDGYFVEIFRQSPESNDIVFHEDGNWTSIKPPKETHIISCPSSSSSSSKAASSSATASRENKKSDIIDLTLDSSDEDDDVTLKVGSDTPVTITPGPSLTPDAWSFQWLPQSCRHQPGRPLPVPPGPLHPLPLPPGPVHPLPFPAGIIHPLVLSSGFEHPLCAGQPGAHGGVFRPLPVPLPLPWPPFLFFHPQPPSRPLLPTSSHAGPPQSPFYPVPPTSLCGPSPSPDARRGRAGGIGDATHQPRGSV
ncbi:E3 SUMO-protein ligase PIAS2-like isoform X2 [Babylonia areolata]